VSALASEYLCSLSERDPEFARLLDQQRAVQREIASRADRLTHGQGYAGVRVGNPFAP
jgi:hypothetical protein